MILNNFKSNTDIFRVHADLQGGPYIFLVPKKVINLLAIPYPIMHDK